MTPLARGNAPRCDAVYHLYPLATNCRRPRLNENLERPLFQSSYFRFGSSTVGRVENLSVRCLLQSCRRISQLDGGPIIRIMVTTPVQSS